MIGLFTALTPFVKLFAFSISGLILFEKNIISFIFIMEVVFLLASFLFSSSSIFLDDLSGQLITIFSLGVVAAETAVGLSVIIIFYKLRGTLSYSFINLLKS